MSTFRREFLKIFDEVEGQISVMEALFLFRTARKLRIQGTIVEIGSYRGKSTIFLAKGSKRGLGNTVHAIEPHAEYVGIFGGKFGPEDKEAFLSNIQKHDVKDGVQLISQKSGDAALEWTQPISLLWIDGDHSYEAVKRDVLLWERFLCPGGIIALHDVMPDSPPARVFDELIRNNPNFVNTAIYGRIGYAVKKNESLDRCPEPHFEVKGTQSSGRIKPNLFIVGAAKSGTSSLWQYLKANPQVYMPEDELYKEPAFFSSKGEGQGYENYIKVFGRASDEHQWIGEASTAYLTDPVSAKRIYDFNPSAKIIIMLRNPADRAYSLYNWMVQDGYEVAGSFEEALKLEEERIGKTIPNWFEPEYYWNYLYFRSGLYSEQVKRYLDAFKDNVLIIKFDEFKKDTVTEYKKVCDFLGVEMNEIPQIAFNPSKRVASAHLQFVLRKITIGLMVAKDKPANDQLKKYVGAEYRACVAKLAGISQFNVKDRIAGYFLLKKIVNIVQNKEFFRNIESKDQRDTIMKSGWEKGRPQPMCSKTREAR